MKSYTKGDSGKLYTWVVAGRLYRIILEVKSLHIPQKSAETTFGGWASYKAALPFSGRSRSTGLKQELPTFDQHRRSIALHTAWTINCSERFAWCDRCHASHLLRLHVCETICAYAYVAMLLFWHVPMISNIFKRSIWHFSFWLPTSLTSGQSETLFALFLRYWSSSFEWA